MTRRVLIMGAAGRDFRNFTVVYRDDPEVEVVGFTATQIPFISERRYPPELAGPRYPDGIAISLEEELPRLIDELDVDEVVFSYSDVSHQYVMHRASAVMAAGPSFSLLGPDATMLDANVPVVAVCAVPTGSARATSSPITQARRTCGWRTWWSSTRSTRPPTTRSRRCGDRSGRRTRGPPSSAPGAPSPSKIRSTSPGSGCWSSRTAPRS